MLAADQGFRAIRQVAALPFRVGGGLDGSVEVLLVTSRETKRWVIPKGNVDFKMTPHAAAAQEAEEEGGVRGKISPKPLGRFLYQKRLAGGRSVMAKVIVFPLAVREELQDWKEKAERERRWFSFTEAAEVVLEPDLRDLIRSFGATETKRQRKA